jgi:hypothetical protein
MVVLPSGVKAALKCQAAFKVLLRLFDPAAVPGQVVTKCLPAREKAKYNNNLH